MQTRASLFMIVLLLTVALGCDSSTDGTSQPPAPLRGSEENSAAQIVRGMLNAYGSGTYTDEAVIRLQYTVDGQRIEDVTRLGVRFQSPNRLWLHVARLDNEIYVACDGDTLRAKIVDSASNNFDRQFVDRPAPEQLSVPLVYAAAEYADPAQPNELLSVLLGVPVRLELTPLALLMSEQPFDEVLGDPARITLLSDRPLHERTCHRLRVTEPDGPFVFWVDAEDSTLRRLEFPTRGLFGDEATAGGPRDVVLVADFDKATCSADFDDSQFQLVADDDVKKLRYFVLPPLPLPTSLFGKTVSDYWFSRLDGQRVSKSSWADRCTVLIWFQNHPASRACLQEVEAVYKAFTTNEQVAFAAVCTEPSTAMSDQDIRQLTRAWNVGFPVVRDLEACGRDEFQIREAPTLVVLGRDGTLQMFEVGANPDVAPQLTAVIERLLAGDDVAASVLAQYEHETKMYRQQLDIAGTDRPTALLELPEAEVAPASEPERLLLTRLWTCDKIEAPGNVIVLAQRDTPSRVLVIDGWHDLAELDEQGQLIARHELNPRNTAISYVRTAVDGTGDRYFVASSRLARRFHVFDGKWNSQFRYPDIEQPHDGIQDVQLADLDGDGELEIYVAFRGLAGVQRVDMQGRRVWSNRSVSQALSLEVSGQPTGARNLLIADQRGLIVPLDAAGREQRVITVGRRAIHQLAKSSAAGERPTRYCGMSYTAGGNQVAVGLASDFREVWSYNLPGGVQTTQVQFVTNGQLLETPGHEWLLAGPDGSIHIISDDGDFFDHFHVGKFVHGLAGGELAGERVLLVATQGELTAWRVNPKADK